MVHHVSTGPWLRRSLRGHIKSEDNPADLLTKVVEEKAFVSNVSYDIYDEDT